MNTIRMLKLVFMLVLLATNVTLAQLSVPTSKNSISNQNQRLISQSKIIDHLVDLKLASLQIPSAPICDDAMFLRRVYLNLTGAIPTTHEAQSFYDDANLDKRPLLIQKLLRSDKFVSFQVLKWADLLRIKSEFPSNLWPNAVQAYTRWLTENAISNRPYDQFVRDLLLASGSNFKYPVSNFYRAYQQRTPEKIAETVVLLFLGARMQLPEVQRDFCELKHFFVQMKYKKTDEWKEEVVYADRDVVAEKQKILMPDGQTLSLPTGSDYRIVFANWLTRKENRYFATVMVNRIWYWLFGVGIVNQPDDFRSSNPPSNVALLNFLTNEFIQSNYDTRYIFELILNSKTYQRSSQYKPKLNDNSYHFSHYLVSRLTAEMIIDAICDITGSPESYMSKVPEPFTFLPSGTRAVEITDGTISSPFLELFGRPSRDVSFESDRNNQVTQKQILQLLNSSLLLDKIYKSDTLKRLVADYPNNSDLVAKLYLRILSRYPSKDELDVSVAYIGDDSRNRLKMSNDLVWSLINTKAFLLNQ